MNASDEKDTVLTDLAHEGAQLYREANARTDRPATAVDWVWTLARPDGFAPWKLRIPFGLTEPDDVKTIRDQLGTLLAGEAQWATWERENVRERAALVRAFLEPPNLPEGVRMSFDTLEEEMAASRPLQVLGDVIVSALRGFNETRARTRIQLDIARLGTPLK